MINYIDTLTNNIKINSPKYYSLMSSVLLYPRDYLRMHEKELEQKNLQQIKDIVGFVQEINRFLQDPLTVTKEFLNNNMDLFKLGALALCAYGLLSCILGNDKGRKYVPISITIYYIIKVLAVIL